MLQSHAHVRVRQATATDASALVRVFRDSWSAAYCGIIPSARLEALVLRRDVSWWRDALGSRDGPLVLEVADVIGGYVTYGKRRGSGRLKGEIYELYLAPSFQGLGLGEHLFEGARSRLDQRGLEGLIVWALAGNEVACDFYRRRGGRIVSRAVDRMTGAPLDKVAFGWS